MAYSFYYLGKYEMARACFQRIVKLDPNSVEAHLGIAIIEEKMENYGLYFDELKRALAINNQHPLVLLHLSEHFLLKGDLSKALNTCLTGLSALERFPKFIRL
jgi:tetratricopeptide (TPR) repeat protein